MSENSVPRETWYARFTRGGQKVNVNLGVPLRGTIPTTTDADGRTVFNVNGKGDDAFERSREAARAALAKMKAAAKTTGDTQAVKAAKTETANARKPHKPLVGAELERLFEYANDNKDVYSLIVTAACTGMRCGDVCRLKWCDVDLPGGFIDVTTAKAGVKATIPIF